MCLDDSMKILKQCYNHRPSLNHLAQQAMMSYRSSSHLPSHEPKKSMNADLTSIWDRGLRKGDGGMQEV